jgi:hypothetical protein
VRAEAKETFVLPLILLALGLGVALTAYELSPRARSRIDDYARAIRTAHAAHRAADAHLSNANTAAGVAERHRATLEGQRAGERAWQAPLAQLDPVPTFALVPVPTAPVVADAHESAAQVATDAGVDHAIAAGVANQQAAHSTAEAAKISRTATERQAVAGSAAQVIARGKRIEGALSSLGVGQCGVREYPHVTLQVKDTLLARLHADGMTVTGNNPWDVDTQLAGVKLRAAWDPKTQVLKLIVTSSAFYASCAMIWERIDPTLRGIVGEATGG